MHQWNNHLTSPNRIVTLASVYEYSGSGTIYYYYVYKIGDKYFFSSTGALNVNKVKLDNGNVENFIVVVSGTDQTIHCILWNRKIDENIKLGTTFDLNISKETIKDFTIGIGLSPRGEMNIEEEELYLRKYNNY